MSIRRYFAARMLLLLPLLWCFVPFNVFAAKVVIDPGHGGADPGAVGVNGLYEKTVNLDIARKVADELRKRGYDVAMTMEKDRKLSLQQRVEFKEREKADLFVSIHANWNSVSRYDGTMVLYYDDAYRQPSYPASPEMARLTAVNKRFAQTMLDTITSRVGTADRGLLPSAAYVIRNGTMPSILVETAFLSNPQDAALLADDEFRTRMALAIAEGIYAFMPVGFADTSGHWAQPSILSLKEMGIVKGTGSGFAPDRPLTRAEFLAMVHRAFAYAPTTETDSPEPVTVTQDVYGANGESGDEGGGSVATRFADLGEAHWAYSLFQEALANGYVNGYPDGTIRPDARISRAEVATLFDRIQSQRAAAGHNALPADYADAVPFRDVPQQHWSFSAIHRLWNLGLLKGMQPDLFGPERPMTRAEAAVLIHRFIERYGEGQQPLPV